MPLNLSFDQVNHNLETLKMQSDSAVPIQFAGGHR